MTYRISGWRIAGPLLATGIAMLAAGLCMERRHALRLERHAAEQRDRTTAFVAASRAKVSNAESEIGRQLHDLQAAGSNTAALHSLLSGQKSAAAARDAAMREKLGAEQARAADVLARLEAEKRKREASDAEIQRLGSLLADCEAKIADIQTAHSTAVDRKGAANRRANELQADARLRATDYESACRVCNDLVIRRQNLQCQILARKREAATRTPPATYAMENGVQRALAEFDARIGEARRQTEAEAERHKAAVSTWEKYTADHEDDLTAEQRAASGQAQRTMWSSMDEQQRRETAQRATDARIADALQKVDAYVQGSKREPAQVRVIPEGLVGSNPTKGYLLCVVKLPSPADVVSLEIERRTHYAEDDGLRKWGNRNDQVLNWPMDEYGRVAIEVEPGTYRITAVASGGPAGQRRKSLRMQVDRGDTQSAAFTF